MTFTTDHENREYRRVLAKRWLRCSICPPHGGENATRQPRHGNQKPRTRRRRGR